MRCLISTLAFLLLLSSAVASAEYAIDPNSTTDTVFFRSTAKLEFIEGKSTAIAGSFSINPDQPGDSTHGRVMVDLRELKTGIETRDKHMRERNLHTDKFPFAIFDLKKLIGLPQSFKPGEQYSFKASGDFFIHGGHREVTATIEATYKEPESGVSSFEVSVRFEMKLDDFQIDRPRALFLKLAEILEIEVKFSAHSNLPSPVINLPEWPKL